jgi:hypothetical protein
MFREDVRGLHELRARGVALPREALLADTSAFWRHTTPWAPLVPEREIAAVLAEGEAAGAKAASLAGAGAAHTPRLAQGDLVDVTSKGAPGGAEGRGGVGWGVVGCGGVLWGGGASGPGRQWRGAAGTLHPLSQAAGLAVRGPGAAGPAANARSLRTSQLWPRQDLRGRVHGCSFG